jgi:hypothetical protein
MSRNRQQSLLHVMQLMHLLQIRLANSISSPYLMLTCARNYVQNCDNLWDSATKSVTCDATDATDATVTITTGEVLTDLNICDSPAISVTCVINVTSVINVHKMAAHCSPYKIIRTLSQFAASVSAI